jgi:hypothetical protein
MSNIFANKNANDLKYDNTAKMFHWRLFSQDEEATKICENFTVKIRIKDSYELNTHKINTFSRRYKNDSYRKSVTHIPEFQEIICHCDKNAIFMYDMFDKVLEI